MTTKSTSKAVTLSEPTLPGLLPSRPVADLVQAINARYEAGNIIATRLPNASERQMLEKRRGEIDRVLTPIGATATGVNILRTKILIPFFAAYPQLRFADVETMVDSYSMVLQTLPQFAITAAIRAIADGTARKQNGRGAEVAFDASEPPSGLEMRQIALKEVDRLRREMNDIDRTMKVRLVEKKIDYSPEHRERMTEKFDDLKRQLAAGMRPEKLERMGLRPDASEEQETAALKAEQDRINDAAERASERAILGEYQSLGIEPQYTKGGQIVSPSIACPDQVAAAKSRMRYGR